MSEVDARAGRGQMVAWGLWDWGSAAFHAVITGLDDLRLACPPEDLTWEPGLTPTLRSLPVRFTPRQICHRSES